MRLGGEVFESEQFWQLRLILGPMGVEVVGLGKHNLFYKNISYWRNIIVSFSIAPGPMFGCGGARAFFPFAVLKLAV